MEYLRARKFKLHFNRINMQRGNPGVWTIHRSDRCIAATKVVSHVEMHTVFVPEGKQPRAYLTGEGVVIDCGKGEFVITSVQQAFALMLLGRDEGKTVKFA